LRDVEVFDGDAYLQTWPCTLSELADGRVAAIWRGVAYPLLPGDRIDVAESKTQDIPAPSGKVVVIPSANANWVLVQGPENILVEVCRLLHNANTVIRRTGRWLGESDNIGVFDWYAYCNSGLSAENLTQVLSGFSATVIHVDDLSDDIVSAPAEESVRPLEAKELTTRGRNVSEVLPPIPPIEPTPTASGDDPALLDAMVDLARLTEEVERLRARPVPGPATKLYQELTDALSALRPDVRLARDSWNVVAAEFRDRAPFWRAVNDLPRDGGRPEGWKQFRSAERWWERHLSTGQDDTGRAYARFDASQRVWELLISWKADQPQDTVWLRNQR
jgi:hypothetical protein